MTPARTLFLVWACVALAGCKADTRQSMMQCETDGLKIYPSEKIYAGTTSQFDSFMFACMGGKGYDFTGACQVPVATRGVNATCYAPSGFVSRWLDKLDPS